MASASKRQGHRFNLGTVWYEGGSSNRLKETLQRVGLTLAFLGRKTTWGMLPAGLLTL